MIKRILLIIITLIPSYSFALCTADVEYQNAIANVTATTTQIRTDSQALVSDLNGVPFLPCFGGLDAPFGMEICLSNYTTQLSLLADSFLFIGSYLAFLKLAIG